MVNRAVLKTTFTFYIGSFAFCISPYLLCLDSLPLWGGAERRRGLSKLPRQAQGLATPLCLKRGAFVGMAAPLNDNTVVTPVSCLLSLVSCLLFPVSLATFRYTLHNRLKHAHSQVGHAPYNNRRDGNANGIGPKGFVALHFK